MSTHNIIFHFYCTKLHNLTLFFLLLFLHFSVSKKQKKNFSESSGRIDERLLFMKMQQRGKFSRIERIAYCS